MRRLLRFEWYRLFHDKIFLAAAAVVVGFNAILFSGSSILELTGSAALTESMKKEIATAIMVCIYGGVSLGEDFADRTLNYSLMIGKSRTAALFAKAVVFGCAADVLLFLFPLLLVPVCTARNGWETAASAARIPNAVGVLAALLFLGTALSAVSLLAAVCFRDVGRTIGIPIALYFVMILLLNSTYAPAFFRVLPIGTLILAADGTVSPSYGVLLGGLWSALLFVVSAAIFHRAELR